MQVRRRLLRIWVVRRWPAIAANFAWAGDGVEPPHFVAVLGVHGRYAAADAVFSTRDTGEDHPVEVAVRASQAVAVFVVLELGAPQQLARVLVQGDKAAVEQARVHPAVSDGDATVVPTAANQVIDLW